MLTEKRKYDFFAELILHRSRVLGVLDKPKDDKVNWLFLKIEERQFGFVYKIKESLKAEYDKPFKVDVAFSMIKFLETIVKLNHTYEVLRGEEQIGEIKLIRALQ